MHSFKIGVAATLWVVLLLFGPSLAGQGDSQRRSADREFSLRAYHLAIDSYRGLLTSAKGNEDVLARIGQAYYLINEPDSAAHFFRQALAAGPLRPADLLAYAHVLRTLQRYDEAKELYLSYAREQNQTVGNTYANSIAFARRQSLNQAGYAAASVSINTAAPEYGPSMIRPDELLLTTGSLTALSDGRLEVIPHQAGIGGPAKLGPVRPLPTGAAISDSIASASFSPDGREVVFTRAKITPGTRIIPEAGFTMRLFIADVTEAGRWTNVRELPFAEASYETGYATFAPDGQSVYFASDRPGGYGGFDIYRAYRLSTGWEAYPENLGPSMNTLGHEITPYFDGKDVYFASNYHPGLGGYDLYRASLRQRQVRKLDHLGAAANSPYDDLGLIFFPEKNAGYFVSNRPGGGGQEDIYYLMPAVGEQQLAKTEEKAEEVAPEDYFTAGLRGRISDLETGRPITGASVVLEQRGGYRNFADVSRADGSYSVPVDQASEYDITVSADGYEPMSFAAYIGPERNLDYLGTIDLLPQQGYTPPPPPAEPAPASAPNPSPTPNESVREAPPTTPTAVSPPAPTVTDQRQGFAVQLLSLNTPPQAERIKSVSAETTLYATSEDGRYRVRAGVYADRAAAERAIEAAVGAGYTEAYVVEEFSPAKERTVLIGTAVTASSYPPSDRYRVRLGAFSNPENFDRQRAEPLGQLIQEQQNELAVFSIHQIADLETARIVREEAQRLGYTGAYILERQSNKFQKVE